MYVCVCVCMYSLSAWTSIGTGTTTSTRDSKHTGIMLNNPRIHGKIPRFTQHPKPDTSPRPGIGSIRRLWEQRCAEEESQLGVSLASVVQW